MSDTHEHLNRVLRGLATGADPSRLLNEALVGALAASRGHQGLIMGLVDGSPTPLTASGTPSAPLLEAAEQAITNGRLARRAGTTRSGSAAAEPIRIGERVVGALAVSGEAFSIDLTALPTYAGIAALALTRRPAASNTDPVELLDALAGVHAEPDEATVMVHIFDAATRLFGTQSGFCALFDDDVLRVAHHRGIDRERLRDATRHPEFTHLLNAPGIAVDDPSHPVVGILSDGLEVAVGLPLQVPGRRLGHLILLAGEAPDDRTRQLMAGFARHVSLAIREAEVYRSVSETEERLASVVQSMPNPVVVVDEVGRFALINSAATELFGLSGGFEVGQPAVGRLGHPSLESLLAAGEDAQIEVALGSPAERVYRATLRRVAVPGGRRLGRVLVLDDITAEKETEQIKSDFVAVIGHELRTPITIMKSSVRALERGGADMAERTRTRSVEALGRGVVRLEKLVDDLLLVSAVEQDTARINTEPADVGEMVDRFTSDRVVVRRPRRIDPISIDADKIRQVVEHLVDNALKYSEDRVTIEVSDDDDAVEIVVADNGPGIYSGDIPHLFDRFRQLDGSSTRAHGGTGLGLYICRRLTEAHGGRIWCESRLEVGTRFHVRLPRDPASAWANMAG